jgi:hypothetical protein
MTRTKRKKQSPQNLKRDRRDTGGETGSPLNETRDSEYMWTSRIWVWYERFALCTDSAAIRF